MATDLLGKRLGDFEIVRELGRGGMGVVYEARQISLSRRVALKVLAGMSLTKRAVDRFHREAEAAAKLHHTNIVPVYATGEQDGTHFYAMELIDGPSLDRVVKQLRQSKDGDGPSAANLPVEFGLTGPFIETPLMATPSGSGTSSGLSSDHKYFDTVAGMIADVADALDHAHKNNVLHRDIKPSNLLLAPDGRLSINDFGLARMLEQPGMTMTGEFVGTPAYMSPEQITSGRIPIDHRTDIYSLGATLYELCTLQSPFVGDRRDQLLAQVVQKEPKPLRAINKRVPVDLETICLKCLEKDPDRRYLTGKELAEDLRRYVHRFAISARRVGIIGRTKKWMKRNPAVAGLLLIAFLAIGTAGFFAWRSHQAEERRLSEERKRDDEMRQEKLRTAMDRAMTAAFATDLPGAEKAVNEAELLGASPGEIRMLRGFIDFQSGQPAKALEHLIQAVRLMPESMSARALLARIHGANVDWPAAFRVLDEAAALTPQTPEDQFLMGYAMAMVGRPADGLKLMDEALAGRPAGIGQLLRAEARASLATKTGTIEDAEAALGDAEFVLRLLPGSEYAHASVALNQLWTAASYRRIGRMDKWDEHLAAAIREADALARFPNNQDAIFTRVTIASFRNGLTGQSDMTEELHRAQSIAPNAALASEEAMNLFVLGRDEEAAKVAAQFPDHRSNRYVRFLIALGRSDGRADARGLLDLAINDINLTPRYRLEATSMLNAVGSPEDVNAAVRMIRMQEPASRDLTFAGDLRTRTEDHRILMQYLEGRISEAELLCHKPANELVWDIWYHAIAWKKLGSGDRAGAEATFRQLYERMTQSGVWWISRGVLIRMKKDPTWPKWIAERK